MLGHIWRRVLRSSSVLRRDVQATAAADPSSVLMSERDLEDEIKIFSKKTPTSVSLRTLVEVGSGRRRFVSSIRDVLSLRDALGSLNDRISTHNLSLSLREEGILRMATFLHRELPVRFARGVDQLDSLALMRDIPAVRTVRGMYATSFHDIRYAARPESKECEPAFVHLLQHVQERHADESILMAKGIYDLRTRLRREGQTIEGEAHAMLHRYLDMFYLKRIALRILIGHYIALHNEMRPNYVGIVCQKTDVKRVVELAIEDAKWICKHRYGHVPGVEVLGPEKELCFPYVPEHLYYIMLELLKNALRAVMDRHGHGTSPPPSVRVLLSRDYSLTEGAQIVIRVSDEGGGIPADAFEKIWCYLFTTGDPVVQASMIAGDPSDPSASGRLHQFGGGNKKSVPLAGLGYGLPLSRLYSRYFGGDLELLNREGEGVDATVRLSRLGDRKEPLV